MKDYELLKNIFELAHQGVYVSVDALPEHISKEVVKNNILFIELENLKKSNTNFDRIKEIQDILYTEDVAVQGE